MHMQLQGRRKPYCPHRTGPEDDERRRRRGRRGRRQRRSRFERNGRNGRGQAGARARSRHIVRTRAQAIAIVCACDALSAYTDVCPGVHTAWPVSEYKRTHTQAGLVRMIRATGKRV